MQSFCVTRKRKILCTIILLIINHLSVMAESLPWWKWINFWWTKKKKKNCRLFQHIKNSRVFRRLHELHRELKSDSHLSKKFFVICFNDGQFKNDEKCFLFHLQLFLFVLEIFKFLSWLFGHVVKTAWLER